MKQQRFSNYSYKQIIGISIKRLFKLSNTKKVFKNIQVPINLERKGRYSILI
jgi:NRPS condensation-like uncharacterized protein